MKINARQILIVGFIAIIAGVIAWYFLMYQSQIKKNHMVQSEINQLQNKLNRGSVSIKSLPALKTSVNDLVNEFDSLSAKLPTKDQVSTITNNIVQVALEQELNIDKILPAIDPMIKSSDYFVKVPVEIVLSGEYLKIGAFFEGLYGLPFRIYVSDVSISRNADNSSVTASLNAYFYVINPGGKI